MPKEKRPDDDDVSVPSDITNISTRELRRRHGVIVGWLCFFLSKKGDAMRSLMECKENMARFTAKLEFSSSSDVKWKLESECRRDPAWQALQNKLLIAESKVKSLEIVIESLDKKSTLFSREQTARTMEMQTKQ